MELLQLLQFVEMARKMLQFADNNQDIGEHRISKRHIKILMAQESRPSDESQRQKAPKSHGPHPRINIVNH